MKDLTISIPDETYKYIQDIAVAQDWTDKQTTQRLFEKAVKLHKEWKLEL